MPVAETRRFGAPGRPDAPGQFLTDNVSLSTALDPICTAERLHLVPITTPKASPESNGMSEARVNTLERDEKNIALCRTWCSRLLCPGRGASKIAVDAPQSHECTDLPLASPPQVGH